MAAKAPYQTRCAWCGQVYKDTTGRDACTECGTSYEDQIELLEKNDPDGVGIRLPHRLIQGSLARDG